MHVWTTPQLNDLFTCKELPFRLLRQADLKAAFLAHCEPGDVAIVPFDDEYREFLGAAKKQGISSPLLLISLEPTIAIPETDLLSFNALALDIKKMGEGTVRQIVHAILKLAARQGGPAVPGVMFDAVTPGTRREKPVEDRSVILEQLDHVRKKNVPVMIAMDMNEYGQLVTARGLCMIKEVQDDAVVFHNFRQSMFFKEMKTGQSVMMHYQYNQNSNSFIVGVRDSTEHGLFTSFPTQLFPTRGFRVQPKQDKLVSLYVHIANEPTTNLKVLDISMRGIGFLCTRDLALDRAHSFTIILPDPTAVIVTMGIIRFKKETGQGIRYGAELRPHAWDEENIAKYIMKREAEIMALLRTKY